MSLKEALKKVKSYPLSLEESKLFVNRESEMLQLQYAVEVYSGEIIGLAGERGIGKTSLFNMVSFPMRDKILVRLTNRYSIKMIVMDILYSIYAYAKKKKAKGIERKSAEAMRSIASIKETKSAGLSYIFSFSMGEERENITPLISILRDVVSMLGEAVVIMDEIDKQRKEEVLLIMDSLKDAFIYNNTTLIVALPYEVYEEYETSKFTGKESYNLENVFASINLLPPMPDEEIKKMIYLRIDESYFEEAALDWIVLYARGNPRRAILTLKEAGRVALMRNLEKIGEKEVKDVIRLNLRSYVKREGIREGEIKTLKALEEGKKSEVAKVLSSNLSISLSSAYRRLERLEKMGLVEGKESIRLSPVGRLIAHLL